MRRGRLQDEDQPTTSRAMSYDKAVYRWGILCGLLVFGGSIFQQLGLLTVTAGKMSFITGSYVVFVPICEHLLPCIKSRLSVWIWISAVISVIGMFFLSGCLEESCFPTLNVNLTGGVASCFVSMFCWVFLLMFTDIAVRNADYLELAIVEDVVVSILTICMALWLEPAMWIFPFTSIRNSYLDITVVAMVEVFAVIFSILGQKYISPSLAALLFSTASVYAALGGYVFLGEGLTTPEIFGCVLIALATVVASTSSPHKDDVAVSSTKSTVNYTTVESEGGPSYGSVTEGETPRLEGTA